ESHSEEDAEDYDLQDLVFGDGLGDVFGEDVDDELRGGVRGGVEGFGGGGGREADTFAGAAYVDGGETDEQRDGGDDFEIDQGLEAEAAYALEIGVACDADYERAEEERGDDDADEAEGDGAEEMAVCRERRGSV